jgi:hypothetical protein
VYLYLGFSAIIEDRLMRLAYDIEGLVIARAKSAPHQIVSSVGEQRQASCFFHPREQQDLRLLIGWVRRLQASQPVMRYQHHRQKSISILIHAN